MPTNLPWARPLLHLPSRTLTADHAHPEDSTVWLQGLRNEPSISLGGTFPQPYTLASEPRKHMAVHPHSTLGQSSTGLKIPPCSQDRES